MSDSSLLVVSVYSALAGERILPVREDDPILEGPKTPYLSRHLANCLSPPPQDCCCTCNCSVYGNRLTEMFSATKRTIC